MEVILLGIFVAMFLAMAVLNKQIAFMGLIGGAGLILLALTIATSGLQMQVGLNQTTVGSTEQVVFTYDDVNNIYSGSDIFVNTLLPIVIGAAGLLAVIYTATNSKW
jgi:hypothetical protein